ncbi:MAG: hypothetical protein L0312_12795 [Acidobacteria bacterium]|nr:hypothetical protein [Acidobacteriota bacterium]
MPNYAATGMENAVTAALTTALSIARGASRRVRIYEFTMSASGTPADNICRWVAQRFTVAPTVTAVTPAALDPADPASITTAGENASAEGTYTAATELFDQGINQRAAYRWVAAPGGELVIPDTAAAGIGIRVLSSAYTGQADATAHFQE